MYLQENELFNPTHMTVDSLVSHAEATSSTLHYILLDLVLPPSQASSLSSDLNHALSHLGVASSISTLLRSLPYHAAKGRVAIPSEITAKNGVVQEYVLRKAQSQRPHSQSEGSSKDKALEEATYQLACVANDHLQTARTMVTGKIPPRAMPVFLSGVRSRTGIVR
jgi:NADH dehydrogenase [ubiquinone] 1 alpha subcomplex assembly factor 6